MTQRSHPCKPSLTHHVVCCAVLLVPVLSLRVRTVSREKKMSPFPKHTRISGWTRPREGKSRAGVAGPGEQLCSCASLNRTPPPRCPQACKVGIVGNVAGMWDIQSSAADLELALGVSLAEPRHSAQLLAAGRRRAFQALGGLLLGPGSLLAARGVDDAQKELLDLVLVAASV